MSDQNQGLEHMQLLVNVDRLTKSIQSLERSQRAANSMIAELLGKNPEEVQALYEKHLKLLSPMRP